MKINPRTYEAYKLLHDGILAISKAEQQGIRVDMEYVEAKKIGLTRKIDRLEDEFKSTNFFKHWQHTSRGKVNIHSNEQLAHYIYDIKKIKVESETDSGQGSTNEEALLNLNIPELNLLLEVRKLKKIRDTYLDAFAREQVNGYIHPFFNLHIVRTYRSSSDSPNFQNIPKRDETAMQIVRRALFPRPGHQLIEVDYSGIEVRVAACYHKDETMLKYLRSDYDMHGDMAAQIFLLDKYEKSKHYTLRQAAKNGFVFPEFYGDYYGNCAPSLACSWGKLPNGKWNRGEGIEIDTSNYTLGDHLIAKGISSLSQFENHIKKIEADFWGRRFADYANWKDTWYRLYQKYGYIDLLTGFRCSGIMGKNDSINYPVQGAAFHCLLWSFIEVSKALEAGGFDSKLIGQIHDSMILDILPSELEDVKKVIRKITTEDLMNAWKWLIVPMDVDIEACPIDASWAEKSKI